MKKLIFILVFISCALISRAQDKITFHADSAKIKINKDIYGSFAEDLGRSIYNGIYVGDNKNIPNTNGVRNDVIKALKDLSLPVLRWPGGCFADTYHWEDAIGPKNQRKPIENMMWGHQREDNSFGTNEFLNFCELIGAEPYLAVNMNSGTVEEAVNWLEYVNHPNGSSYMTDLRQKYGRTQPWHVKYWGIGNESWDCGGHMTAQHYINLFKQFSTAMTDYNNSEKIFRVAVGPGMPNYDWTEQIMKGIPAKLFEGLSIHWYAVNWGHKSSSYDFTGPEYFATMQKALFMNEFITKNSEIMDKYDPKKKIALIVDEWGGWYDTDPDGHGALYQQNTMRDAMIAGVTLNIFNNHADRVRMANLAQAVNVLQSLILTKGNKMILTPTYYVMKMYKVHQNATMVPVDVTSADFVMGDKKLPAVSASGSIDKSGKMHISLTNIDNNNSQKVEIDLKGYDAKSVTGKILTSPKIQDHNTFDDPTKVIPAAFNNVKLSGDKLALNMPPASVIVLELTK